MRILYISTSRPDDFTYGGAQRSNYIRDALRLIADVDTIVVAQEEQSSIQADWDADRVIRVNTSYDAGPREKARLRSVARRLIARADADQNYDYVVARYFRTATLVGLKAHHKLVIDADDFRKNDDQVSPPKRVLLKLRAALVPILARRAHHIWLVDPRDREMLRGGRCSMLPNTARKLASGRPPNHTSARLLMVGLFAHIPNREGLRWFARHVLPRLGERFTDVKLHAVGRYYDTSLELLDPRIVMRGFVDDLGVEYGKAALAVCPVFSGSGTQIKVVEALINGVPTVASDFSYQGFFDRLVPGKHLLVARDVDGWIDQIGAILERPEDFQTMSREGQRVAEENYSVEAFRARVQATFLPSTTLS